MLNLLFVYSSGRHQAAQRGFAGSSAGEVWGHGKISALIFPVLSLGSAGNMDPEVSFTLPEVGAEIYPLTSDRAKFKTLQGLKNSVGKKWRVWKRMRKKIKKKTNQEETATGLWHGKNGENVTYLRAAVKNKAWMGTKGFVPLLTAGRCPPAFGEELALATTVWLRTKLLSWACELFRGVKNLFLCASEVLRRARSCSLIEIPTHQQEG